VSLQNLHVRCISFFIEQFRKKCINIIQKAIIGMLYSSFIRISNEFPDKLNMVAFNHRKLQGTSAA